MPLRCFNPIGRLLRAIAVVAWTRTDARPPTLALPVFRLDASPRLGV